MPKLPLHFPEHVCLKAVESELTLMEAAELFLEAVPEYEYLEFACPGFEVLFESPDESERAEHEARLMAFFTAMLDEFTYPQLTYQPPVTYPIRYSPPAR